MAKMQVQVRMITTVFATVFKTEKGENITPFETGGLRRGLWVTIKLDWKKNRWQNSSGFPQISKKWSEYDATDEQKKPRICVNQCKTTSGGIPESAATPMRMVFLGSMMGRGIVEPHKCRPSPLTGKKTHAQLGPRGPVNNKGGNNLNSDFGWT